MTNEVTLDPDKLAKFIAMQREEYIDEAELGEDRDIVWSDIVAFDDRWGHSLASLIWDADGEHHVFCFPDDLPEMEVAAYAESTDTGDSLVLAIRPKRYEDRASGWGVEVQVASFSREMKAFGLRGEEALTVPIIEILVEVARELSWLVEPARNLLSATSHG